MLFHYHAAYCPVLLLAVVVLLVWNPSSNPVFSEAAAFTIRNSGREQWRLRRSQNGFHRGGGVFARNDGTGDVSAIVLFSSSSAAAAGAAAGARVEEEEDDSQNAKNKMKITKLKKDLTSLAVQTRRGFDATSKERKAALAIIDELARFNPTREPAAAYYNKNNREASTTSSSTLSSSSSSSPTLAGKWTLIYTDAPDITSLQQANPLAELGRIGQECEPPYIRNVIEWKKPSWMATTANLPFAGNKQSSPRIIQKIVTEASATPDMPTTVNLAVAGLSIEAVINNDDTDSVTTTSSSSTTTTTTRSWQEEIEQKGLLPTLLNKAGPIYLQGPWRPPFGKFEILYLDEEFRIIRTGQGYIAVNRRNSANTLIGFRKEKKAI